MTLNRWSGLLGLLGLGMALYLTAVHYDQGSVPLACAPAAVVNCDLVLSSAESAIGPVPVALLGVIWFAIHLGLVRARAAGVYRLAWAATGLAFVFYFVYAELFLIGALCLWCTAIHLVVVALFLLTIGQWSADRYEAVV